MTGLGIVVCSFLPAAASAAPAVLPANPAAVRAYAGVLHKINPHMPSWQSRELAEHLLINASRWKVDANILVALVSVESAWRTGARSWVGAIGLGQLMPGTAALMHVNPRDPYQNLQGAARYLGGLLHRYRKSPHQYSLAFAAYNAGPRAVARYQGIPPFAETQNYVVKVMSAWHRVARGVHVPAQKLQTVVAVTRASADESYWTRR
ncbi:MAG: lytic transglycosylase domain-containing protein [Candidatus Baltobacteraceae bacterium]